MRYVKRERGNEDDDEDRIKERSGRTRKRNRMNSGFEIEREHRVKE